jgi:hypothetical protein
MSIQGPSSRAKHPRSMKDTMDQLAIARALHVVAVVLWIGGVGFVTTVLLPAVRRLKTPAERVGFFDCRRTSLCLAGPSHDLARRSDRVLHDVAVRPLESVFWRRLLVDACDGRGVALVYDYAIRRRAARPSPLVSSTG